MNIGGYLAIVRVLGKFSRAYSRAVKLEQAKDNDVTWMDYITCIFVALGSMDEGDLDQIVKVSKQLKAE